MKYKTTRLAGKGSKSLVCPTCKKAMYAMTFCLSKMGAKQVPNRKYCPTCDKIWKFTMTVEG